MGCNSHGQLGAKGSLILGGYILRGCNIVMVNQKAEEVQIYEGLFLGDVAVLLSWLNFGVTFDGDYITLTNITILSLKRIGGYLGDFGRESICTMLELRIALCFSNNLLTFSQSRWLWRFPIHCAYHTHCLCWPPVHNPTCYCYQCLRHLELHIWTPFCHFLEIVQTYDKQFYCLWGWTYFFIEIINPQAKKYTQKIFKNGGHFEISNLVAKVPKHKIDAISLTVEQFRWNFQSSGYQRNILWPLFIEFLTCSVSMQ